MLKRVLKSVKLACLGLAVFSLGLSLSAHACLDVFKQEIQANTTQGDLQFRTIIKHRTIKSRSFVRTKYIYVVTNTSDHPVYLSSGKFKQTSDIPYFKKRGKHPLYQIFLKYKGKNWVTYLKPDKANAGNIALKPGGSIIIGGGNFSMRRGADVYPKDKNMAEYQPNYRVMAQSRTVKSLPTMVRLSLPYRTKAGGKIIIAEATAVHPRFK